MKKCVYLAVLAAFVLLTVHLVCETRRLQGRVQQLEEERVRAAHAKFVSAWVDISDDEREGMVNIYRSIAQAYTNRDIMAMRIAMLKLPVASDHLSWQLRPPIEKPLTVAFNDNFLRTTQLLDFDTSEQLAEFLWANIELALFFGDVYTRHPCSHCIRGSLRSAESAPCRVKRISCDDRCGTDARKFGIIRGYERGGERERGCADGRP